VQLAQDGEGIIVRGADGSGGRWGAVVRIPGHAVAGDVEGATHPAPAAVARPASFALRRRRCSRSSDYRPWHLREGRGAAERARVPPHAGAKGQVQARDVEAVATGKGERGARPALGGNCGGCGAGGDEVF